MNEGDLFKFNEATEVPATPEEKLAGELALEESKLEANLEDLSNDIKEIGGEEALTVALEKNPNIVAKIAGKMALIMPMLITVNTVFSGSFAEAIKSGNAADIVTLLVQFTAGSAIFASIIESVKIPNKKEETN